jgi:hypothetical protein
MNVRPASDRAYGRPNLWEALAVMDDLLSRVMALPKGRPSARAYRRTVLLLLFARAVKTYHAIRLLCADGYGQDALVLLRSMVQTVVTAQYLTQGDTRQRVARYRAFHAVEAAKLAQAAETRSARFAALVKSSGRPTRRQLQAARKRAERRFPDFKRGGAIPWAGQPLDKVAEEVGQGSTYDFVYRLGSQYEHGSFYALYSYARKDRMSIAKSIAPSDDFIDETLATVLIELILLSRVISRAFRLGLRRDIDRIEKLLPSLIPRVTAIPVSRRVFVARHVASVARLSLNSLSGVT